MMTVAKLIEELQKYPTDALCYAYEGEIIGVVIVDADKKQLGYIPTNCLGYARAQDCCPRCGAEPMPVTGFDDVLGGCAIVDCPIDPLTGMLEKTS